MPELPEVETVRRRLEELVRGKQICDVELRCAHLRSPVPTGLMALLRHSKLSAVGRRGKYLLLHLDRATWLVHLGMSGRFLFGTPENAADAKHDHLVLHLSCGLVVRYNDFRRFGSFAICPTEALPTHPVLSRLGIDALSSDINGRVLLELLANRTAPIKTSLLNQALIAGIGNMYACEILYWSNIHPTRPSCSLSRSETHKVARAVHDILGAAVEAGGRHFRITQAPPGHSEVFITSLQCSGVTASLVPGAKFPACRKSGYLAAQRTTAQHNRHSVDRRRA